MKYLLELLEKYQISDDIKKQIKLELEQVERQSTFDTAYSTLANDSSNLETLVNIFDDSDVFEDSNFPEVSPDTDPIHQVIAGYEVVGKIDSGGMGEIYRVKDSKFNRILAMKIIHERFAKYNVMREKFIEEAQIISQLQHPNIIPIHDVGSLPDGRVYYTMKEVKGRNLRHYINKVHHTIENQQWKETSDGWSLRRLISSFQRACAGMAFAHNKGVIHLDLKPENIMIDSQGEVLVMDWGLAKLIPQNNDEAIITRRSKQPNEYHKQGKVAGTPAYMSIEQAKGDQESIDACSDVYSLGATLYEILTGVAPYNGDTAADILGQVLQGPPPSMSETYITNIDLSEAGFLRKPLEQFENHPPIPAELSSICDIAMARHKEDRYQSANSLAKAIQDWLDGATKRDQALRIVEQAIAKNETIGSLHTKASVLLQESTKKLENIASWESEEVKAHGWSLEDQANSLLLAADIALIEQEQLFKAALTHKEDLVEAHIELVDKYWKQHRSAEQSGEQQDILKAEIPLKHHLESLPSWHNKAQAVTAYLKGDGALDIVTDPPGASVILEEYVLHNRRLIADNARFIGTTPISNYSLPKGSYRLTLKLKGHQSVVYPVHIQRQQHWQGVAPGEQTPTPIWLPPENLLAKDDCYVPAGWFFLGGDPDAMNGLPLHRLWLDGFIIKRFPISNEQYIAFLTDLLQSGQEELAFQYVPREKSAQIDQQGSMIYNYTSDGRFLLVADGEGRQWLPQQPVSMIDCYGAAAYAKWYSSKQKGNWRLPSEYEWEKSARGVDRRIHVWGDNFDASWSCMRFSHSGDIAPADITHFPLDCSVYGVRGLAGNMCDWTMSTDHPEGLPIINHRPPAPLPENTNEAMRIRKGGSWYYDERISRVSFRYQDFANHRNQYLGFRIARSLNSD